MKQITLLMSFFLIFPIISFSQNYKSGATTTDKDGMIFRVNNTKNQTSKIVNNQPNNKMGRDLSITWESGDVGISNNIGYDSWDTRIDVGDDATVGVVYNDEFVSAYKQKIYFRKKEPGSNTWSDRFFVDKGGEIGGRNCHKPAIAISPNGDMHVIYNVWAYENTRNYIGYSYYDAANDNWHDGVKISDVGGSVSHFNGHHDVYSTDDNLPVVFWGFDNRIVSSVEEVYMKYYDGTTWSDDILVSSSDNYESAYYPHVTSMGNQKAMIIFEEMKSGNLQLMYRIYDEITHELSEISPVPGALCHPSYDNCDIVNKNDGTLLIGTIRFFNTTPWSDTLKMISYNIEDESFAISEHVYTDVIGGPLPKVISLACNMAGDCSVIYSDLSSNTNGFMEFDYETGFTGAEIITNQTICMNDLPDSEFDFLGNLHLVWDDLRNNSGNPIKRDVFYKMGTTVNGIYTINFNITEMDGTTPIADADVSINNLTQTTDVNGNAEFEDVLEGEYYLLVYKEGYESYIDTIIVDQDETFDISLDVETSIVSFANSGISIYPNPSKGQINISFPEEILTAEISVMDITGRIVHNEIINQQKSILNMDVKNGYYLLKINYNGKSVTSSIIVE